MPTEIRPARAVVVNDGRIDRHHGCTRVMESMFDLARSNGIQITATALSHSDWRLNSSFVEHFDRADLVIVNGEGTLHHSRPAGRPLLAAGAIARDRSKRSALINFSWQDNDPEMERALGDFDLVSVRESKSLERVRPIRPDCRLVPDLSLYGAAPPPAERKGIGFGDSVLERSSLELLGSRKRFNGRFISMRFVEPGLSGTARFARSYVNKRVALSLPALTAAARRALATYRHSVGSADELVAELARLELLVTGRFHGAALALCATTPVLVTKSNTDKLEALVEDAGLQPWRVIKPQDLSDELLDRASHWHADEKANVEAYLAGAAQRASQLFADLSALVR